jgi:hypothetical protein
MPIASLHDGTARPASDNEGSTQARQVNVLGQPPVHSSDALHGHSVALQLCVGHGQHKVG